MKVISILTKFLPHIIKNYLKKYLLKRMFALSEVGQDFFIYGEVFNEKKTGYFIDIGAYDGINRSNTYILEKKYNWKGICIEANPDIFKELKYNRSSICLNNCLDNSEGIVEFTLNGLVGGIVDIDVDNKPSETISNNIIILKTKTLVKVLEENNAPNIIDYLSIDVEGAEERILSGFEFNKYTFRCVTIERPSQLLRTIFKRLHYILIKEIPGLDCFYVHQDFLEEYKRNLVQFYKKKALIHLAKEVIY